MNESHHSRTTDGHAAHGTGDSLEMPSPTAWPLVLALGVTLLGTGLVTNYTLSALGLLLFVVGLTKWIGEMMPGAGHMMEPLVPASQRAKPVDSQIGGVQELQTGMPGYRLHMPEKIHPYSAGIKGGIVGGIAMTIPAFLYGFQSGHGPWWVINLQAAMLVPGFESLTVAQLESFNALGLTLGAVIHGVICITLGLIYGVLLPMLPGGTIGAILWGGVVAPLLWTGASYGFMGVLNPLLREHVNWPSFILAQFVFGIVVGIVVVRSEWISATKIARDPRSNPWASQSPTDEARARP